MSDVIDDDDTDALAAEFVLGTLDADERTHANLLLDIDDNFRGKVRLWERRLGELHLMVEPVEPAPQIWERIKAKVEGVPPPPRPATAPKPAPIPEQEQAPEPEQKAEEEGGETEATLETTLDALEAELRKVGRADSDSAEAPDRPPELFADRVAPEHDLDRPFDKAVERQPDLIARDRRAGRERPAPYLTPAAVDDLRPTLRRWRAVAIMMMVLVVAVGGLLAAWRYAPERLPPPLRATNLLHIEMLQPPQKPKAPPESQFDE